MSANGNDNANDDPNIIFIISDTKLYALVVTLSVKNNQKLSKVLFTGFERSAYLDKYKTKIRNKSTANEYRYFLDSKFTGVNRLFVLVYSNQDDKF